MKFRTPPISGGCGGDAGRSVFDAKPVITDFLIRGRRVRLLFWLLLLLLLLLFSSPYRPQIVDVSCPVVSFLSLEATPTLSRGTPVQGRCISICKTGQM